MGESAKHINVLLAECKVMKCESRWYNQVLLSFKTLSCVIIMPQNVSTNEEADLRNTRWYRLQILSQYPSNACFQKGKPLSSNSVDGKASKTLE